MQFKIEMTCDNAAFEAGNRCAEVARILREAADRLESQNPNRLTLRDANGNVVGAAGFDIHN